MTRKKTSAKKSARKLSPLRTRESEKLVFTNPDIIIEDDQMSIEVYQEKRIVKHIYRLRALRNVDRYKFKFMWTGSGEARVNSESAPNDELISNPDPNSLGWQKYTLLFDKPLKKSESKELTLTYAILDENHGVSPFQTISYTHVAGCTKLTMHLTIHNPLLPEKVYLTEYSLNWEILNRREIQQTSKRLHNGTREYTKYIKPKQGVRYHIEWQLATTSQIVTATAGKELSVKLLRDQRLLADTKSLLSPEAIKHDLEANKNISIKLVRGGGMLVDDPTSLELDVTNNTLKTLNQVDIEILPSAEYNIDNENPVSLRSFAPKTTRKISFTIRARIAGEVAVNVKVNGQLMEPALRLVAIHDNPYVYGNPIDNPGMFIGRQSELSKIFQAVIKPVKQDILLIGERRSGKTSILYQLRQRFLSPYIPVYVIINEAPAEVMGVVKLIVRKVVLSLVEQGILPVDPWKQHQCKDDSLVDNLKVVLDAARQKLPEIQIVLLVDEADYLLRIDDHLQNMLRAALQSGEVGAGLRVVVTGTSGFLSHVVERSSPFFNHFRHVTLTPLSAAETEELITKPAVARGYYYETSAVKEIRQACGGHPYYCQRICYEVFALALQHGTDLIKKRLVEEAIQKVITSDDAFKGFRTYFWDTATLEEQALMKRLAWTKTGKMKLRTVPSRLLDWQVVTKAETACMFTASLFREWIKCLTKE